MIKKYANSFQKNLKGIMEIKSILNILQNKFKSKKLSDFNIKWVFVEITNACNIHCKFCPSDHIKRKKQFMDFDLFKKIIDNLNKLAPPNPISLNVLGEPLLHKSIFNYIDYCNKKNIRIYLLTNCILLFENIVEICKRDNIEALVLSVQTPTPSSYELRGSSISFEDYMKGIYDSIEYIIKTKSYSKMRVEIHLANTKYLTFEGWNILNENESALKIIKEMSRTIRKIYYIYQNNNYNLKNNSNLIEMDLDKIPENILDLREWDYWGHETTPNIFIRLKYFGSYGAPESIMPKNIEIVNKTEKTPCIMVQENLSIFVDGTITTCCLDVEGELNLGNIKRLNLKDALISKKRIEYLEDVTKYELCRRCLGEIKLKNK